MTHRGMSRKYLRGELPSFISFCATPVKFERAHHLGGNLVGDFAKRWTRPARNWSLQGQRGKGAARFATGCSVDFFSAGPRYFLCPYLNLHVFVRRTTFMRKVSVTPTDHYPTVQSATSGALFACARSPFLWANSIVSIIYRDNSCRSKGSRDMNRCMYERM